MLLIWFFGGTTSTGTLTGSGGGAPSHVTTVKQEEPCPKCYKSDFYFSDGVLLCATCSLSREEATRAAGTLRRDPNGSLLCEKCNNPYPYASPDDDMHFVCRSCKSYEDM